MSQTSPSQRSRSELSVGTIFRYRNFEGFDGVKDRYFVVVGTCDTKFYCYTTSTQPYLWTNPRFATDVSCIIPERETFLPKKCVVDCRRLEAMDDIILSNRLNTGRVTVLGMMPDHFLGSVLSATQTSRGLAPRQKPLIIEALTAYLKL